MGRKPRRNRIALGLWATHPFRKNFPQLFWLDGVGIEMDGWFASWFINSWDRHSLSVGDERTWASFDWRFVRAGIGYRAGLITGYDKRLLSWAKYTPVLPITGLLLWTDIGPVGIDVFYVYRAITLEVSGHF